VGEVLEDPVEGIPAWNGSVEVHAAEEEIGRAVRSALISALRRSVDRLEFHDVSGAAVYDLYASSTSRGHLEPFLPRNMKLPWFFGVPSESGVMTAYWARTAPVPENLDPDRDGCGLIWCNAAVPFKGAHVRAALEIMRAELELCHFDPLLSVSGISERAAYCLAAIAFDRSQAGADERALACRRSMMARLSTAGYYPYRLGIDCMDGLPASRDASDALLRTLKSALDPRGVLAPGRYISSQSSIRSVLLSQPGRDRNKGEDES
jgi:4-cresol dehydrogenase (hydroxylating)